MKPFKHKGLHTVISTPSSARIKAAYEVASSAFDILKVYEIIRGVVNLRAVGDGE